MTIFQLLPWAERLLPLMLFSLYLMTAFRICRYSSWKDAGSPNPFLPRRLKVAVARAELRMRFPS